MHEISLIKKQGSSSRIIFRMRVRRARLRPSRGA
jgi:hypothetical protein